MTDPEKMQFLLRSFGITQAELAKKAGVTQAAISEIINGKRKASYLTISRISAATGLNQDWWFNQRGKIFLGKETPIKPVDVSKDELIRILIEQNETLMGRVNEQKKLIAALEEKLSDKKDKDHPGKG